MKEPYQKKPFDFPHVPPRVDLKLDEIDESTLTDKLKLWPVLWRDLLKDGKVIPAKSDLSMPKLAAILPNLIIFERLESGDYTLRLVGTDVEAWLDRKLTGLDPLSLVPEPQRRRVKSVYDHVINQPCGFYISEVLMLSQGKKARTTTLKLPLTDKEGTIRYFLAVYQFSDSEYVDTEPHLAAAEHHRVDHIGYIDIGFGVPADRAL
ncbi:MULTISPECIES: PAS domain-containing protein [Kordiimonas]|jgi:hypothetical protein|uniref:PAS domain-containing protein n=1 Tax=Kordiimonas TaxID=288021 RepID=UPI00258095B7|nr:PAS domain-containing protein [Kordiimonas sp. UBA4487]